MSCADVGDHSNIRFTAAGQSGNFTRPAHPHFNHQSSIVANRLQNRERHTNVVVVVAFTGTDGTEGCQGGTDQFTGGCLPC
ncbi:MAG: Uncharacterised protein [Synechococcus sp. CC9902]|nr:MAG: Uncharacterised protein [Synechococcus sp. CC9902]